MIRVNDLKFLLLFLTVVGTMIALFRLTSSNTVNDTETVRNSESCEESKGSGNLAKYYETLVKLDEERLDVLRNIDFENEPEDQLEDKFHRFVVNPFNSVCRTIKRFGGKFGGKGGKSCGGNYPDGQKFVCMDSILRDIEAGNCVVYSFGIKNDWSFEDIMDRIGCAVYAFDPSVDFPRQRGNKITFEKIGVTATTNEKKRLYSLSDILERNSHSDLKISYLKFDIERHELAGLPAWYASGALQHVQQFGFEFHLREAKEAAELFKTIRDLTLDANYRLIVYDLNGRYVSCRKEKLQDYYFNQGEIVFKKLDDDEVLNVDIQNI